MSHDQLLPERGQAARWGSLASCQPHPVCPPGFLNLLPGPSASRSVVCSHRGLLGNAPAASLATQLLGVFWICRFGSRKISRVLLPEWPNGIGSLPKMSGRRLSTQSPYGGKALGSPRPLDGMPQLQPRKGKKHAFPPTSCLHRASLGHHGIRSRQTHPHPGDSGSRGAETRDTESWQ